MKENLKYLVSISDNIGISRIIFESFLYYVPLFMTWTELNVTLLRFTDIERGIIGMIDDFLIIIYLCGLVIISFQIPVESTNSGKYNYLFYKRDKLQFILGIIFCFGSFLLLHIFYYKQIKAAKRYNKRRIKSYSLSLILLLIALIFELIDEYFHKYTNNNNSHSYLFDIKTNKYILLNYTIAEIIIIFCLFCSQIIVFYVTLVSFRVHPSAKDITDPNSKFFQSIAIDLFTLRFGILIMIVTGESILAILINPKINSYNGYCSIFVSFLLIYIIQQIYFDTYATNCEHALHCIFKPGSVAWVFAHLPLSYFITCIGLYSV